MDKDEAYILYKEAEELIQDIYKFKNEYCKDLTLMESIIEYSFKKEIPLQDIGNSISEHKDFMVILEKQLIRDKYIKHIPTELDSFILNEDEW